MILTVVGLVLAIPFALALVLLVGELVLLVLLLPLALLVRVLFKRPWTVEATSRRRLLWSEQVHGWTESGVRVLEVAAIYERGDEPRNADRATGVAGGEPGFPKVP
jgi:hypothetical protein